MTNETRERDYKHEYQIRQKRQKRLVADIDKQTAEAFQTLLNERGQTFAAWLNIHIKNELRA
jgi:hypothetical protein